MALEGRGFKIGPNGMFNLGSRENLLEATADYYNKHLMGPAGAEWFRKALKENPSTPVANVLSEKAIKGNPALLKETVYDAKHHPIGYVDTDVQTASGNITL